MLQPDPEKRFRENLDGRMVELDGMRGVAMLWVLIYHAWFLPADGWAQRIAYIAPNMGLVGLEMFFGMSGFLITGILLKHRDSPEYFSGFYGRRLIRILPLYFSYLFFVYYVIPNVDVLKAMLHHFDDPAHYREGELYHWLFLSNYWYFKREAFEASLLNSTWSLAVEEQFYVVWPCIVLFFSRRALLFFCACVLAMSNVVRWHMILSPVDFSSVSIYIFTFGRLDSIAIGCALSILAFEPNGRAILLKARWVLLGIGLAIYIPAVAWTTVFFPLKPDGTQGYERFLADEAFLGFGLLGVAIWSSGLIAHLVAADPASWFCRAMRSHFLRFIAKYSYGMYLFHIPAIHLVALFMNQHFVLWRNRVFGIPLPTPDRPFVRFVFQIESLVAVTGLTLFLAVVSWFVLEVHFLKLKKSFPYRKKRAPGPPPEANPVP